MKTLDDYNRLILGISLKLKATSEHPVSNESLNENVSSHTFASKNLIFLADREDINANSIMVKKLLKAINKDHSVFMTSEHSLVEPSVIFSFGENDTSPFDVKVLKYPSFTQISQNIDLKRKLWAELKKHS